MKQPLLLLASLLLASAAQAQFGIRAGAHYATLATETSSETFAGSDGRTTVEGRVGYQVGVFYERKLAGRLSLVPELQYSRRAANVVVSNSMVPDNAYFADYRLTLHYLNVPVMVRVALGKFYLEAGPQASFLLAAHGKGYEDRMTFSSFYQNSRRDFDRSATDRYQRVDVGAGVGAGVVLPGGFALGLRYSAGFLSITRELQPDTYGGSLKNQVAQASVSYQLRNN